MTFNWIMILDRYELHGWNKYARMLYGSDLTGTSCVCVCVVIQSVPSAVISDQSVSTCGKDRINVIPTVVGTFPVSR